MPAATRPQDPGLAHVTTEELDVLEVSLAQFLDQVSTNPIMAISVLLTLGVIFVNGRMHPTLSPPASRPAA